MAVSANEPASGVSTETPARSREGALEEKDTLTTVGLIFGVLGSTALLFAAVLYAIDPGVARLAAGNAAFGAVCVAFYAITHRKTLARAVSGRSTVLIGLELLMAAGGLLAVLALNYYAANNDHEWDLTRDGIYTLHPQSKSVAGRLERPIKIYGFFRSDASTLGVLGQAVELYRFHTDHLELIPVNPDTAPTALVKRFELTTKSARIIFEDPSTGRFTKIKRPTEEAMTNALIELVERRQRKVYFLGGHGEPSIADAAGRDGLGTAATLLGNEGLGTETLSLIGRSDVPDDASAVVVIEPKTALLPNEAEALKSWLDRGGRALILLDPGTDAGLERVFRPFGVVLGDDMVVDDNPASRALGFGLDAPVVQDYEPHPITDVMRGQFTMFFRARSVSPRLDLANLSITTLIQTSPSSWAEGDWRTEETYSQGESDLAGPVPIALAVTKRTTSHPRMLAPEARLVVIGDHHFATNRFSAMTGNANLFVNAMNWLVGDEDRITIRPPQKAGDRLAITAAEQNGIMFFSVNLLPLLIIGIGFSVWAVRRRR